MRANNIKRLLDSCSYSSSNRNANLYSSSINSSSRNININLPTSNIPFSSSNSRPIPNQLSSSNKLPLTSSSKQANQILSTIRRGTSNQRSTNTKRGHITSSALKQSNYKEQEYTVSIIENYAREVGISAFNFRTMEFFITQFIDNEAYVNTITMINYWRPLEIVMNQKSENSSLHLMIKNIFSGCYIGFLPRKNFNEDQGKMIYMKSTLKELNLDEINMKYVCMASLSGLMSYLDSNPNYIMTDSYLIRYHYLENHLNISFNSTLDLELLLNKKYNKTFGSLYSLYRCRTVSGCRLLRSNILQPLAIASEISKRYDAVEELSNNSEILEFIKNSICYFKELEIFISKLMCKNEDPTEIILKQILIAIQGIRNCIKILPRFNEGIQTLSSALFKEISSFFSHKIFEEMNDNIELVIEDFDYGSNVKVNREQDSIFFLIKEGYNNVLDVSRKTYLDTLNEIYSEFETLKNSINDPNMKLLYSDNKGYYITLNQRYFNKDQFAIFKKNGKKISCSNIALISYSERIKEIKSELIHLSISNLSEIITYLKKKINYLYVLSSHIASIDVICAFADYATSGVKTTRPIIENNTIKCLYGKNCRHPILEKYLITTANGNFYIVPNDFFFVNHFNLLLLKGPNASGKTTYMKELALLIIMSQIGSFVPCDFFIFSLRNFIYTKFDTNDSIEENKGAFIKQVIEIQKVILSNSNKDNNSLILLDEPFDNSNDFDVFAIAISFLDMMNEKFCNSYIAISSHNNIITQLAEFYFNAVVGSMVVDYSEKKIDFLFKFKFNAICGKIRKEERNYGIVLAEMIGMNEEVVSYSKEIANKQKEEITIGDCVECSDRMNVFKMFCVRMYLYIFEIMCSKRVFVIEDEVKNKIIALSDFILNSLK